MVVAKEQLSVRTASEHLFVTTVSVGDSGEILGAPDTVDLDSREQSR
jgi:hypothetical protein